jgi:hypothetical protein
MIRRSILVFCLGLVATGTLYAANKEQKRLENSGVVMQEIMNTPENIPKEVLEKAECVIVAERARNSRDRGALRQCLRLRAAVLDFKSADKRPISFC